MDPFKATPNFRRLPYRDCSGTLGGFLFHGAEDFKGFEPFCSGFTEGLGFRVQGLLRV